MNDSDTICNPINGEYLIKFLSVVFRSVNTRPPYAMPWELASDPLVPNIASNHTLYRYYAAIRNHLEIESSGKYIRHVAV